MSQRRHSFLGTENGSQDLVPSRLVPLGYIPNPGLSASAAMHPPTPAPHVSLTGLSPSRQVTAFHLRLAAISCHQVAHVCVRGSDSLAHRTGPQPSVADGTAPLSGSLSLRGQPPPLLLWFSFSTFMRSILFILFPLF